MSEIVKSSDVEDVLFSIRRLVSDTPEAKPAPKEDSKSEPKAPALILTSALRVNDPATEPEQIDLEDMGNDLSHFRDAVSRDPSDIQELPSLDEVFADKSNGDQPRRLNLSEVASDDAEATVESSAALVDEYFEDEDTGNVATRKWADDPDVETLGDFAGPEDTFGGTEDESPAVVEEPDTSDTDVDAVAEDWIKDAQTEEAFDDEDTVSEDLESQIVDPSEEPATASDEADTQAADGLADFDESILDEDALRDMVTEIVREELSGELGERITRNVRKLVRREIHRALMAREFD
jgi:hypothetical protein